MPSQLSGGQQQRIAMARAIVIEPDVLLMDEPLSALDENLREEMRREMDNLQQMLGVTTIFVTHDQREAFSMSDKILVMKEGRKQQEGGPRSGLQRTGKPFCGRLPRPLQLHQRTKCSMSMTDHVNVRIETGDILIAENKGGFSKGRCCGDDCPGAAIRCFSQRRI